MYFQHSAQIWEEFPELVPGVLFAAGVTPAAAVTQRISGFLDLARSRLAGAPESEWPQIRAWRRAFSRMGLKPTQYRCASESLLRRLRLDGTVPHSHPLVELCNAVSMAYAIPVAAFDVAMISGGLEVRRAKGDEEYLTFGGEVEHPAPGEVIFADEAGQAHARRWTNRQSGRSAVRESTTEILSVAEAMHGTASADMSRLMTTLAAEMTAIWSVSPGTALPQSGSPRVEPAAQLPSATAP